MQYRVLYDYALNTGAFYEDHCNMARDNDPPRMWELHVRVNVLPRYRKEHHEPYEGMSVDELALVAKELREYYAQHIKEL